MGDEMESGKLYSIERAAEYLGGISKWTVHAWLAKGKLRRTKVGARTMICECDLQAFLASCNPEPAQILPKKDDDAVIDAEGLEEMDGYLIEACRRRKKAGKEK